MKAQLLLLGYWKITSTIFLFFRIYPLFPKGVVGCLYDVKLQIRFHY